MYKLIILIFVLLATAGCIVQQPAVPARPATEYYEHTLELPRNAQIIEDLGNGWIIYKVEVMGEIRWFKSRFEADQYGKGQYALQCVTELSPPATYFGDLK